MFCPSCGSEERQRSQYCRACGTDLRIVRVGLERPDEITASAASARDRIGRALAAKIGELDAARDLKKFAEDVLPEVEKFLESPQEKRLRRVRKGVVTAVMGLGVMLMFLLIGMATGEEFPVPMIGAGLIALLIGLGIVINGLLFTVPRKRVPDHKDDALEQNLIDMQTGQSLASNTQKKLPPQTSMPVSVTEHTTHHLSREPALRQDKSATPE
ncbi:MAG TPA: hypothetical protein VM911_21995 [Pyrinomonadaceae bacterium]|nr:hypothetical protein [Pyrinomonadaceae bacterium]